MMHNNITLIGRLDGKTGSLQSSVQSMLKNPADRSVPEKRISAHPQHKERNSKEQKSANSNNISKNEAQSNDSKSDGDGEDGGGDDDSDRQGALESQPLEYQYQTRPQLPQQGFVRLREILQFIPVSKSTWWAGVKSGRFPQPVRSLGPRIAAWRVEDIQALINDAY